MKMKAYSLNTSVTVKWRTLLREKDSRAQIWREPFRALDIPQLWAGMGSGFKLNQLARVSTGLLLKAAG